MLVQLNNRTGDQHDNNKKFTATATGLPVNPSVTRSLSPVVTVLGQAGRVAGLGAELPAGWTVRVADGIEDLRPGEIVLITNGTERDVLAVRDAMPRRATVVTLVDEYAPADLVAAVLTAGADVCVRGGQLAILAGHLVACRRRQLADRWSTLQAAAAGRR